MSTSAQIIARLVDALKQSGVAGEQVTCCLRDLHRYTTYPAIGVFRLQDVPAAGRSAAGIEMRRLSIQLRLLEVGSVAETATDALHEAAARLVYQVLAAECALEAGSVEWHVAPENPSLGVCHAHYQITYRRQEGEL